MITIICLAETKEKLNNDKISSNMILDPKNVFII